MATLLGVPPREDGDAPDAPADDIFAAFRPWENGDGDESSDDEDGDGAGGRYLTLERILAPLGNVMYSVYACVGDESEGTPCMNVCVTYDEGNPSPVDTRVDFHEYATHHATPRVLAFQAIKGDGHVVDAVDPAVVPADCSTAKWTEMSREMARWEGAVLLDPGVVAEALAKLRAAAEPEVPLCDISAGDRAKHAGAVERAIARLTELGDDARVFSSHDGVCNTELVILASAEYDALQAAISVVKAIDPTESNALQVRIGY